MDFEAVSEPQERFVLDDNHFVVIALGGRGSGKTHCAVAKTIRTIIDYPGSHIWFVAPDEARLEEGLLDKFRELCPQGLLVKEESHGQRFTLANKSFIRWRSTNTPAGLRAGEQNLAVFDEAAWSPYRQARNAIRDLRANLRLKEKTFWCPTQWVKKRAWIKVLETRGSQSRIHVTYKHQLVITTTPAIGSFINEMLEMGDPPGVRRYNFRTEDNLTHLKDGYLEQLREAHPGEAEWKQEAMGELVGVESAIYPMFDSKKHVMAPPTEFKLVVGGIDWGWTHSLAIVIFGFTSSGVAFGLEEFVAPHITSDRLLLKVEELRDKYRVERFFCDPSEPRSIADLNMHNIPASAAVKIAKPYRASRIASRLETGPLNVCRLYLSPDMKQTIRSFKMAGNTVEDPRKLKEAKSGTVGDDPIDATEYAVTGGELLMGAPVGTVLGRGHQRHEGARPSPVATPWRLV